MKKKAVDVDHVHCKLPESMCMSHVGSNETIAGPGTENSEGAEPTM